MCAPEPPPPADRRGGARGGQARDLREAARRRRRRGSASDRSGGRQRPLRDGALRVSLLPDGPRGARTGARAADRSDPPSPRHVPAGLAAARRGRQLARRRGVGGASRAFADIGSHWCDLVEFISGHRIARLSARTLTAVPEREAGIATRVPAGGGDDGDVARSRPRTPRSSSSKPTGRGRQRGHQPDLGRAARTGSGSRSTAPRSRWPSTRRSRSSSGADDASVRPCSGATPRVLSAPAARLALLPAGHAQGYGDCFAAFVADSYDAFRDGRAGRRAPCLRRRSARRRDHRRGARRSARAALGRRARPESRRLHHERRAGAGGSRHR